MLRVMKTLTGSSDYREHLFAVLKTKSNEKKFTVKTYLLTWSFTSLHFVYRLTRSQSFVVTTDSPSLVCKSQQYVMENSLGAFYKR